jgi:tetratricopeptide (TPR) repeat protein
VFQEANSLAEAIRCYSEAIRLRADFAEAYYNRGVARRATGDHKGAEQDYNKAVQFNPDYARNYVKPGLELQPVGCFPKLLLGLGSVLMIGGFGSFGYFVLSFIGMVFASFVSTKTGEDQTAPFPFGKRRAEPVEAGGGIGLNPAHRKVRFHLLYRWDPQVFANLLRQLIRDFAVPRHSGCFVRVWIPIHAMTSALPP